LVDALGEMPLGEALEHLARAGLADARVMLRRPEELSDGQRFRFALARFFAGEWNVLLADEFCATLDRVTAKVVAHQLRKFVTRSAEGGRARTAIVATTHEDLIEDLRPDVVIVRRL
jgi:ABC-type ATPase with predicted acetyltransferase domain